MKRSVQMRSVVTWLVLGAWCAAVPAAVLAQTNSIVLEQILVKVNGEIITKTQLEERQVQFLRNQRTQGTLDENTSNADMERLLSEATPQDDHGRDRRDAARAAR